MPFPEYIRQQEIRLADKCAICHEAFPPGSYIELHSATSFHLVRYSGGQYKVTDPPLGHENLRGRIINWNLPGGKRHDGYCLCPVCHDEIHKIALAEAHLNDFPGKAPPPGILEEVTLYFVKRGKPIVVEEVR